jgi:hypothetical protein
MDFGDFENRSGRGNRPREDGSGTPTLEGFGRKSSIASGIKALVQQTAYDTDGDSSLDDEGAGFMAGTEQDYALLGGRKGYPSDAERGYPSDAGPYYDGSTYQDQGRQYTEPANDPIGSSSSGVDDPIGSSSSEVDIPSPHHPSERNGHVFNANEMDMIRNLDKYLAPTDESLGGDDSIEGSIDDSDDAIGYHSNSSESPGIPVSPDLLPYRNVIINPHHPPPSPPLAAITTADVKQQQQQQLPSPNELLTFPNELETWEPSSTLDAAYLAMKRRQQLPSPNASETWDAAHVRVQTEAALARTETNTPGRKGSVSGVPSWRDSLSGEIVTVCEPERTVPERTGVVSPELGFDSSPEIGWELHARPDDSQFHPVYPRLPREEQGKSPTDGRPIADADNGDHHSVESSPDQGSMLRASSPTSSAAVENGAGRTTPAKNDVFSEWNGRVEDSFQSGTPTPSEVTTVQMDVEADGGYVQGGGSDGQNRGKEQQWLVFSEAAPETPQSEASFLPSFLLSFLP